MTLDGPPPFIAGFDGPGHVVPAGRPAARHSLTHAFRTPEVSPSGALPRQVGSNTARWDLAGMLHRAVVKARGGQILTDLERGLDRLWIDSCPTRTWGP